MKICAEITGIKYEALFTKKLNSIKFRDFDINNIPSSCTVINEHFAFSISKWVSPKRTRSYPFARVYDTLNNYKKLTVIPIIKDEGCNGDRDFIQWDTISLMSLLDVYVILAYYEKAEKNQLRNNKITNQQFSNVYIKEKIKEISNYHSSPLHWNLQEINATLPKLIKKVKISYKRISEMLNVSFHDFKGIDRFEKQFFNGVEEFMIESRRKAKEAQIRELHTTQPKEFLSSISKATITIKNYLGGLYFLTTDEIKILENTIMLIEAKHTKSAKLPSKGDIKDGLLKMILYCNLKKVKVGNIFYHPEPILKLTSEKIDGKITNSSNSFELNSFMYDNNLSKSQINTINVLLNESNKNDFKVIISEGRL